MGFSIGISMGVNAGTGAGGIPFAAILALNPELAFAPGEVGAAMLERTGAAATTPCAVGDLVGSLKNFGTKGGWLVSPSEGASPYLRAGVGRYLEFDGVDDAMEGALAAMRAVPGWTFVLGLRNTAKVGQSQPLVVIGNGTSRATLFISNNIYQALGRRQNVDASAFASGGTHSGVDLVATAIGDYTNTDAIVRVNGVQEGSNLTWLTAGLSDNDHGNVAIGGLTSGSNQLGGNLYSALAFPSVLSGADLLLAERWTAQQVGISI